MSDANRSPQPRHVSLLENVSHQTVTFANTQGALVIGCDCPWLTTGDLELAYARLAVDTEVVLGPATDGGYYLLGLRSLQKGLFEDMPWGSPALLAGTRVGQKGRMIGRHPASATRAIFTGRRSRASERSRP